MKKRLLSALLAVVCCLTLSAPALAAGSTVHAAYGGFIAVYNESLHSCFYTEKGYDTLPIVTDGSVYIPAQSAAAWMGKELRWDPEAGTVSFTGSTPIVVEGSRRDAPARSASEQEKVNEWGRDGVDIELHYDYTVMVDGQKREFFNVNGERLPPAVLEDTLFLPIRGIAQLCGKEITYSPSSTEAGGGYVYVRAPMTEAELAEVTSYLEKSLALVDKLGQTARQLWDIPESDDAGAWALVQSFYSDMEALDQLPMPQAPYFAADAQRLQQYLDTYLPRGSAWAQRMNGGMTYQQVCGDGIRSEIELARQVLTSAFLEANNRLMKSGDPIVRSEDSRIV